MSNTVTIHQKHEKPLPRNTFKYPLEKTQQHKKDDIPQATPALFAAAMKKVFRWKTIPILLHFVARRLGWKPRNNTKHLERFQNLLYQKLENFFGY